MSDVIAGPTLVSLPPAALAALHEVLEPDLAREVGFASGEGFERALREALAADGPDPFAVPAERFWRTFADFFADAGWGRLEAERVHPAILSLRSDRWVEAEGRRSGHPACHLTTGVLADLLSRVAGNELAAMEVQCRAAGDGGCRWLVGSVVALDLVYQAMQRGESFEGAVERLG